MSEVSILDMCCGSCMFWIDKKDNRAVFINRRVEQHVLCDGHTLQISPDIIADFRALPFAENIWLRLSFTHLTFNAPAKIAGCERSTERWIKQRGQKISALDSRRH